MKNMKLHFQSISAAAISLTLILSMAACGEKGGTSSLSLSKSSSKSSSASASTAASSSESSSSKSETPAELQKLKDVAVGTNYEICGAKTGGVAVNIPLLGGQNNGDYGLFYYAASGSGSDTQLIPMTHNNRADYGGDYWYYTSASGRLAVFAPTMYDGIGVADPTEDKYPVICLVAPKTGTLFISFNATAYPAAGSDGFTFSITQNGFAGENAVKLDDKKQCRISVKEGDKIYFIFKTNGKSNAGDRCGYYSYFAYTEITE